MKARVLVIDDEIQILRAVSRALTARDYEVIQAQTGEQGLQLLGSNQPDLVILDLNLPGIDGFSIGERIRSLSLAPILILSVREDEQDKVRALDLGADDYLVKPFGTDELMARVRALLRRTRDAQDRPRAYALDEIEIDLGTLRIFRAGEPLHLTRTEWRLLEELAAHAGRLLTHRWLLERVWGIGYGEDVDVLRVFISQLRKKIEPNPAKPQIILTEPGIGYRWVLTPVSEASNAHD